MFNKNLKYYRLKKNMSKKQLADACGITPMAITNYENGDRTPDMQIINELAKALGIYVADFIESRNDNLVFKHCEFRKSSKLSKAEQEFVQEYVEEYFSRFFDTIDCLGGNPLPKPIKTHNYKPDSSYHKNALTLRCCLSLPQFGPISNLITSLENLGILVLEVDVDNSNFSGMNGLVNEYPYIVINKNMRTERKRTTIAHELAHMMFNWNKVSEKEQEKMATLISGAFLITDIDLIRELGNKRSKITNDFSLICEEYGISIYLLVTRAKQVNMISENQATDFFINANKANWKQNEPNRVKNIEEPSLFKQLVFRAINEEDVNLNRGAELLGMPINELKKYCGQMEVNA